MIFLALRRRAETSGFLGFAGLPAAPARALGTSQGLVPLVSYQIPRIVTDPPSIAGTRIRGLGFGA